MALVFAMVHHERTRLAFAATVEFHHGFLDLVHRMFAVMQHEQGKVDNRVNKFGVRPQIQMRRMGQTPRKMGGGGGQSGLCGG